LLIGENRPKTLRAHSVKSNWEVVMKDDKPKGTKVTEAVSRRTAMKRVALAGVGAASLMNAASLFPKPAIAANVPVKFTLPWLPTGGFAYVYAATEQGYWKKMGLDVTVSRGFGSGAATQAIAQGKFDIGLAATGTTILGVMKGLDLMQFGTVGYDSTMGILVTADGPIKTLKDIEGKKLGVVPNSGEVPYLPAFFKGAGVDIKKIEQVALDAKVLEQTLLSKQIDAQSAFGVSSIPNFLVKDVPVKMFLYKDAGLAFYSNGLMAKTEYYNKNKQLCQDICAGLMEAVKFSLTNPDDTIKMHLKANPEVAMTNTGEAYTRYGMGIFHVTMLAEEAKKHSIGYGDPAKLDGMAKATKDIVAPDLKVPPVEAYYTNDVLPKVTMTDAQWKAAADYNKKFAAMLGQV
jgi:NitT/TauT family transport system substrate-binding protein